MIRCGLVLVASMFLAKSVLALELNKDFEETPWVEESVELPPFPSPVDLVPFQVGVRSDVKFMIDAKTLSVGGDGVVRYVMVVVSDQGAKNVSFEGMRCETAERRAYAFGRVDGGWSKARSAVWNRVRGDSSNHYVELFLNYFCVKGSGVAVTADGVRRLLLRGGARASSQE